MKNTSKSYYLHIYNLKTGDVYLEDQEIYDGVQLAISSKGDYIALLSLDQVRFYHLEGKRLTYLYHYKLPQPAVCLAFHPLEPIIAVGDQKGQIIFYYFSEKQQKKPLVRTTMYHWHAHGVRCLAFDRDGTYMISGGKEGVLVIWQLGTGSKRFLPRLGSPIIALSISTDHTLYAISLEDNSIRIINSANLSLKHTFQGVKYDRNQKFRKQQQKQQQLLFMMDPLTHAAVFNGIPSSLQFYNINNDSQIMEVS
jgi:NET1-associated nuclear protein 1 (U3 small nucleolar RNA-associated protein 17)